ncbi:hypothetical protein DXG03_001664 [Asterophora parasitica]|uniref:Glutathione peroxidase n=1 Tax=Asterophora parasitica TaxID=117018 RepID=A0A9P7GBR1_9AGAR|nr:hypothetical protein DXG03_001664 [Asterophora parasitica]
MSTFYSLKAERPGGKVYDFADLKGKTVLIVNVASAWYVLSCIASGAPHDHGSLVDLLRSTRFGGQEPKGDSDIAEFCTLNHGVTFPLMSKSDVNGDNTNEVYKWLKEKKAGILGLTRIKWNFEKFLVDKEGNVVSRWASTTTPEAIDAEVAKII